MTDNVVNLSPNRNPILSKCWRLLPVSSLYRKIDFPPQNSNVTSRCAAGSICFLLAVCFIIDERESEEQRVSYLFWGRCEDAREEHHATGNTANLRENVLGEVSVNTGIRFEFDENISQTVDAWLEDDPVWLRLPPDLHSHAVLADSCTTAACLLGCTSMQVWTPTVWWTGGLTRIRKVDWLSCILNCWLLHTHGSIHGVTDWTLTWSWVGLFSAGCRECFAAHAKL